MMQAKRFIGKEIQLSTEIIAGLTTFLTMSYIMFVNPEILSQAGMDKRALILVTCIVSGIITMMTGLMTNSPFAMAPGMGLNAFFTYSLVIGEKIRWETALGIVFISGLFFLVLTATGFRQKLVRAIPRDLILAITVGIGVFISFIGLQHLGLVVKDPETFVKMGAFSPQVLLGLLGFFIIVCLDIFKIRGSLLFGILSVTLLAMALGFADVPKSIFSFELSISPLFLKLDIIGALKLSLLAAVFSLMFVDLFDSIGTIIGLSDRAGMTGKDGAIPQLSRLLGIDALATMTGALFGTSTTTTYIESAAGISTGGRSGLTSVVTGFCFLGAIFFVPVIAVVPSYATAPALIMVGYTMLRHISDINFKEIRTGLPSFVIILMIAFSYSISAGLAFGFLSYSIIKILVGEIRDLSPTLWLINLLCLGYFIL